MNGTVSYTKPVSTTLDLPLQEVVDSIAGEAMEHLRQRGAGNLAVIAAERETGAIRSYLGSDFTPIQTSPVPSIMRQPHGLLVAP